MGKKVEVLEKLKSLPPNLDEYECPRCGNKHSSFTREIGGIYHMICESCLDKQEKEDSKLYFSKKIKEKYSKYLI